MYVAVVNRVGEEVLHDPADSTRIEFDLRVSTGSMQANLGSAITRERANRIDARRNQRRGDGRFRFQLGSTRIESRQLEQFRQSDFELFELLVQDLGGASGVRIKVVTPFENHVSRQLDRRERRAQFVADV